MIPYGTFTFFLIAFIVLIPVIILGFLGKRSYIYNGISTAIMIVIIFASDKHNLLGQKYLSAQLFVLLFMSYGRLPSLCTTINHDKRRILLQNL